MKKLFVIFFLLISGISSGQVKDYKVYIYHAGMCGLSLTLLNDKTYIEEIGCEGSHNISYGNWSLSKKDTILFKPIEGRQYKIIDTIIATNFPGDSITVVVLDKHKVNVTAKVTVKLFIKEYAIYSFKIDTTRTKKIGPKKENAHIQLNTLNGLFAQHIEIPTNNNNHFVITLNMPSLWIPDGYRAYWMDNTEFSLIQGKGKLLSFPELRVYNESYED